MHMKSKMTRRERNEMMHNRNNIEIKAYTHTQNESKERNNK